MIAIDLSKQEALDADPKKNTVYFTGYLDQAAHVCHNWRSKRNYFELFRRNCESNLVLFSFHIYND